VIAGHRDSFFRSLENARVGDLVVVRGSDGVTGEYRLASSRVTRSTDIAVAGSTTDRRLTLITCYPFHWIGPAPDRLVWTALPAESSVAPAAPAP
jgi:sortase A